MEYCNKAKIKMDYAKRIDLLINKIINYKGDLDLLLESIESCIK